MLSKSVEWFRGGPVSSAHRLSHNSSLGSRVIKKNKRFRVLSCENDHFFTFC